MSFTTNQNLEKPDAGAENFQESMNDNSDSLEIGRKIYITEYGEDVAIYDPICVKEADDLYWKADGNDTDLQDVVGIATAARTDGQDGYVYGTGALVTYGSWDWDLSKPVFLADDKTLSQTAGTNPIIIGFPTAPTVLLIHVIHLNYQLAHIADPAAMAANTITNPAACAAVTATSPGSGADATTPNGAEWTAAVTDLGNQKTAIDANNTQIDAAVVDLGSVKTAVDANKAAIDAILARLEVLKISATS